MAFINENISDENRKKYNIDEINQKFHMGEISRDWTIDKERDIYIRIMHAGREEASHCSTWTLFWKNELIFFELENISTSEKPKGIMHGYLVITRLDIPEHLLKDKKDIMDALVEAFTAYKDGGVYATATEYTVMLEFKQGDMI